MRRNMGSVISFFRVVRSGLSPVARSTGTRTAEVRYAIALFGLVSSVEGVVEVSA